MATVTPAGVKNHSCPTAGLQPPPAIAGNAVVEPTPFRDDTAGPGADYLCKLSANTYKLEFLEFRIVDGVSNEVFFEVRQRTLPCPPNRQT